MTEDGWGLTPEQTDRFAVDLSWTEKIHDAVGDAFEGDDQ